MKLSWCLRLFLPLLSWAGTLSAGVSADIPTPQSEGELFDLIGKLKNRTLPAARIIERCVRETNGFVLDYKAVKDRYAAKEATNKPLAINSQILPNALDHDLNLIRNFSRLKEQNTDFFAEIEGFIQENPESTANRSLDEIERAIKEMQKKSRALSNRLYPLAAKESQFLYLLSASRGVIQGHLSEHQNLLGMLIGKECQNAAVAPQILALQADAQHLVSGITQMRDYVVAVRLKRDSIVDRLLTVARHDLEKAWREEFVRQGKDTLESIDGTLAVMRLASVFEDYWITATMNGLADSKHLKYLQYEEPLRILTIESQRLKKFEQDFRNIPSAPQNLMLSYANKSLSYQKLVQDNIDKLLVTGWKGQLDRQILLNERRKLIAEELSPECLSVVDMHLEKAKSVKALTQYRAVESLYQSVVALCTK